MLETAKILVVDDERIIREGCSRLLTKAGHEVITAQNGQEALDILKQEHFDMVLLDIKMPEMDGMQVMEVLRENQTDLLVLVITGYASIETAVEAMKAGAYDLLIKPFSADALRIAVNRALDHLRLAWEMEELKKEQARSLKDIANEQSRVRTIMNSMACGILVTDDENRLVLYNPLAPRMLEMKSQCIVGNPISDMVEQKELVHMLDQLFDQPEAFTVLEQEVQLSDRMWLRARAAPVRSAEGNILGAVTVLQDISHLKELSRMKSEFVTMVSHELKAPIAAIRQQLEVLINGMAGDVNEKQAHLLGRAQNRAQGLIDLINELLDLSRIEAGRSYSQQQPLDLAPIIHHAVEFVMPQVHDKQQQLTCDVPESLPLISADPANMDEVLLNLLSNAIKYTPEGGSIEVKAFAAGDFLSLVVADTGYGMVKDDIPRIFDKFYRIKNEKTKTIAGTGLGLPIVRGIVEAHLGTIKVESQLGKGSTFTIELPLLSSESATSMATC
jgi:two-component system phosphate regulon sensor histidine kinase PhoR